MTRVLNASGCLDALLAPSVANSLDVFVTKTVTPEPRAGNPPVRIAETDVGMLNSIGLANPGIERFRDEHLPALERLGVPLWVSVGGFSASDFARCCAALDDEPGVEAIELNVSCPNVTAPADAAAAIVEAARGATSKPLYAKLSPALPDVPAVALAAEAAGAEGLSLTNTLRGLTIDTKTLLPRIATATGGLSGPALRPVALAAVFGCARVTRIPIVGMGGIETGEHALAFLAAGASDVALGTALFADPRAPRRVRAELARAAERHGFSDPADAIGSAHGPDKGLVRRRTEASRRRPRLPVLATEPVAS